ncbi:MAG: hypothetical protein JWO80_6436 [Bryobacterales bacterium]|nr:hypothetical protein [Bryobacterales bacterium]
MRDWLRETHGPGFELLRHFLRRFFDSDIVTAPGQMTTVLIGGFSVLLPWFPVLIGPLRGKYSYFSHLAVPGPYTQALRADELWLVTLMMAAIGLLTAIKWQSLFPGLQDYRALGSLPLRPRQVFLAKLLALLLVTTAAVAVLNLFPAFLFPSVSRGRWAINPSRGGRVLAHAVACVAASYFFFFGLLAIQGVLLNLLRPRRFGSVTGYLQGFLVALMLILIILSFSIQAQITNALLQPDVARWLPPVWFLGLYQAVLGDQDPAMRALAKRAIMALAIAVVSALATYLVSYQRHRVLLVEGGMNIPAKNRRWIGFLLDWLVPRPREKAVIVFMAKTLAGSSRHRMILMGYGGFGLAVLLSGIIGMKDVVKPDKLAAACFVYAHVILLVFLLLGFRHLFSLPTELKANWIFQITEAEGRREWLRAVDRFVLVLGAVLMLIIPLPFEVHLLAWRAVSESVLFAAFGLLCYEGIFSSWEKLPFTCSYLLGKTPMLAMVVALVGLLTLLPVVNALLLAALYNPWAYLIVLALLLGARARIHDVRMEGWRDLRFKYDDLPEPVIRGLNLAN